LEALRREPRLIRERLAGSAPPEAADRLIDLLAHRASAVGALLRDGDRTTISWVTLPEELSLAETADALRTLDAARLPVAEIVVNRVLPPGPPCPVCDRRRSQEHRMLDRTMRTVGRHRRVRVVHAVSGEPRGIAALASLGRQLAVRTASLRRWRGGDARPVPPPAMSAAAGPGSGARAALAALEGLQLVFCGGKGGVGKTTVAAAIALQLARAEPRRRLLLLSTDPAHSLGDVFGASVGDHPGRVAGAPANLMVREVDAARAMAARRDRFDSAVQAIVGAASAAGVRGIRQVMELAPPGIDELFGFVSIMELAASSAGKPRTAARLVVDTAPTGHTLRLLQMPEAAREWTRVLMRLLLKYRQVVPPGSLAAELLELSRDIGTLQTLMHDVQRSGFVVVTRAARVPRCETVRLFAALRRLAIPVPLVFVNARTLAPGSCPWCRRTSRAESEEMVRIRRAGRACVIIQTPLAAPPPRGVAALDRWVRGWTS
jgi:arsenite-transporting ATPase